MRTTAVTLAIAVLLASLSSAQQPLIRGDRDRAIQAYRRSLELDPTNANAVAMLRKLGAA